MLPAWYIKKHRTHVGGLRLFTMERIKIAAKALVPVAPQTSGGSFEVGLEGGICGWMHWEYRYWMCELDEHRKPNFGVCRRCGASFSSFQSRREHGQKNHCNLVLTAAYKKLLDAEHKCIICNEGTHQQKFGVWLCGNKCQTDFFYQTFTPQALKFAILLAERDLVHVIGKD